jgi:hypothetical protein
MIGCRAIKHWMRSGQHLVKSRQRRSRSRASCSRRGRLKHSTHSAHRYAGPRRHYLSDVFGVVGHSLFGARRMFRSIVNSPSLRLNRLTSSSRGASSSFGCARTAFLRDEQKAIAPLLPLGHLLPVRPRRFSSRRLTLKQAHYQWLRDASPSAAVLLRPVARLPFATSPVSSTLYLRWLDLKGEQDRVGRPQRALSTISSQTG